MKSNPNVYSNNNKTTEIDDFDEGESENVDLGNRNRGSSARKRRDSYDYASAAQQLGMQTKSDIILEDGVDN